MNNMKVCAEEVCGKKKVGGMRRKGCEWWNDSFEEHVKKRFV